jgi:serine/threonine protein kinase
MTHNQGAADISAPYAAVVSGLHPLALEGGADCADCAAAGDIAWSQVSTDVIGSDAATPEFDADEPDWADAAAADQQYEQYDLVDVIGEGVYGTVHLGRARDTGEQVAIKQLKLDDDTADGVPAHIIREVSLLRDFIHPNIVELKDFQNTGPSEYQLIFEYVPDELYRILRGYRREGRQLPMEKVLGYSRDLLSGIHACHARLIIHRDLKPQNLLIHPVHGLKICDFGLARALAPAGRVYTPEVVTLWYRCMELLLGRQQYGAEVDTWSAGCIVAEMVTGHALFPGDSEIGTVFKIMQLMGSPTEATWPGFQQDLPLWSTHFPSWPPTDLGAIRNARPELGEVGIDLLCGLLALNPASRPTARRARAHAFFSQPGPA